MVVDILCGVQSVHHQRGQYPNPKRKGVAVALATLFTVFSCQAAAIAEKDGSQPRQQLKEMAPRLDTAPAALAARPMPSPPDKLFKIHAGVTQEYVLGPGDVLTITDLSSDEDKPTSVTCPILPDGTAVIRYCGVITAAGKSLREINQLVNERAQKLFVNPEIVVNLARQRPTTVYVLGEVVHTGLYAPGGANSGAGGAEASAGGGETEGGAQPQPVQAVFNVTSALQMAGGLKDSADVRHIHVTRLYPKQVFDVDLWKLMLDGDVSEDLILQPGDVVFVPKGGNEFDRETFGNIANNKGLKVRVFGAVRSPGMVLMEGDDDVVSVIAKVGGPEDDAASKWVYLHRTNHDGSVTSEKIDFKKAKINPQAAGRVRVRPGDIIEVRKSALKVVARGAGRTLQSVSTAAVNAFIIRGLITPSMSK